MKFTRTDLVTRVEAEIARREERSVERHRAAKARYLDNSQKYLSRTSDAWKTLADTIRRRLRAGTPMTWDDVPTELHGSYSRGLDCWSDREPEQVAPDTGNLAFLLELLRACTDEEITTASLERMGFRWSSLFRGDQ